ncbi:cellulose binding domain-containing protein [Hamadaea tsunoensis]|uniref:cellulose binding domain-containing protein n=1 Tax=Hamadaea tsunoensis TaxID=53368 RepID=UPI000414759D|nr:cellulose binding domain-containing protein [Hamadaea tsunoensis]
MFRRHSGTAVAQRRSLATALTAALVAATAAVVTQVLPTTPANAAGSDPYSFKNAQIVGGGFVPGIIFNQSQANLIYARTDIGGAYRWDQTNSKWIPLLDWVGFANWGLNGAYSLATDAVDPNRVYVAAGMYTNSWDPNNGAILRSSDKGATWAVTQLPFKLGGNMPGRGQGEKLAIDPNKNSILYFGAPSGNGLWRSTDSGVTWAKVTAFPNVGNYVQSAGDAYLGDNQGIAWVTFDKSTGTAGSTTQGIYVGVNDKDNTVYRSTDGGTTWSRIAGQPTGYLAHKGVLDPVNHVLYISTSDTGGPYDGAKGEVWKYNITTGVWTNISPVLASSSDDYFGYSGLTIDRLHPNTIMVATQISWWPDMILWRSTDAGATWSRIWDWNGYPSRTFRYTQDISAAPWLTFGTSPQAPEVTPKLGWMNESVEIDPFNSNRMMYGTGATLYGTENLTNWDAGNQITIKVMAKGLEETAVLDLISPPSGANLLSALGDVTGFRHTNLDAVPSMMFTTPNFSSTTSIDFAESNPNYVVRVGNVDKTANPNTNRIGISNDNGANWYQGQEPSGVTGGGTVAVAADGSKIVWAPQGAAVSYGGGSSWTSSTGGVPSGARVAADRVNSNKFYAFSGGTFYVSTNGGASFTATVTSGLPTTGTPAVKAVFGREGDIWLAGGDATGAYGLWHSTNSGASFTKLSNVQEADNVGFGKASTATGYPTLFTVAKIDNVRGVFASYDAGTTWLRINDDQHQYGNIGGALTGDPRVFGRVYIGTNGRGIIVADRVSTASPSVGPSASASASASPSPSVSRSASASPSASASASPSASPSASRSASASPSVSPSASSGGAKSCSATYTITNQWPGGFGASVDVKNTGTGAITGWTVKWTFANGQTVTSLWSGNLTQSGANVTVTNMSYNGALTAGQTTNFGFNGSWSTANTAPTPTCTAS